MTQEDVELKALENFGGIWLIPPAVVRAAVSALGAAIQRAKDNDLPMRIAFAAAGIDWESLLGLSPVERFSQVVAAIHKGLGTEDAIERASRSHERFAALIGDNALPVLEFVHLAPENFAITLRLAMQGKLGNQAGLPAPAPPAPH